MDQRIPAMESGGLLIIISNDGYYYQLSVKFKKYAKNYERDRQTDL